MSLLLLTFLLFVSMILIAGFCVLGLSLWNSRPGYEDATGFHEGALPGTPAQVMPIRVRTAAPVKDTVRDEDMGRPVLAA